MVALQEQIDQLPSFATASGERQDAIEACQAGILRLSGEVADAADNVPAYDQRAYAQVCLPDALPFKQLFTVEKAVKALSDHLNATIAQFAPKSRFQFKPRAAKAGPDHDTRLDIGVSSASDQPAQPSITSREQDDSIEAVPEVSSVKDYNQELSRSAVREVRKPSFSTAREIAISGQTGLHIILPSSASRATAAGSLTELKGCVVDMSVPTASGTGAPFASLTLKKIYRSLIVAGRVAGPVHLTGLTNSVVVVSARQVRVHECVDVTLYLHCASHPIIEDCKGMHFAPLPASYVSDLERNPEAIELIDAVMQVADEDEPQQNQWDQVDDFKWLKEEHSPNWDTLPEKKRVSDDVWTSLVPQGPGLGTEDILAKLGIPK
jgi:tubulin-specific chaperone C